jgi:hypothetical protein
LVEPPVGSALAAPELLEEVRASVTAWPERAPELELDVASTKSASAPLPELPRVALGLAVAFPVPVEPVFSEEVRAFGTELAARASELECDLTPTKPVWPPFPELPEAAMGSEVTVGSEMAFPVSVEPVIPGVA